MHTHDDERMINKETFDIDFWPTHTWTCSVHLDAHMYIHEQHTHQKEKKVKMSTTLIKVFQN